MRLFILRYPKYIDAIRAFKKIGLVFCYIEIGVLQAQMSSRIASTACCPQKKNGGGPREVRRKLLYQKSSETIVVSCKSVARSIIQHSNSCSSTLRSKFEIHRKRTVKCMLQFNYATSGAFYALYLAMDWTLSQSMHCGDITGNSPNIWPTSGF